MKAKTIRMTKQCKICQCGFTYKSEKKLQKGNKNGYICNTCLKVKNTK